MAAETSASVADAGRLEDGGPIYTETDLERLVVEPFNAASNILFLAIVVYWGWRLRREPSPFVARCMPVLFIGFVGGTVYHAFRAHQVWLLLDWVPIVILTVAASVRYVRRLSGSAVQAALVYALPMALVGVGASVVPDRLASTLVPGLGYTVLAAWVAGPLIVQLRRTPEIPAWPLATAVVLFVVAIGFRSLDRFAPWPFEQVGTHFLWHLFGAASAHFVILFVFLDDQRVRSSVRVRSKSHDSA